MTRPARRPSALASSSPFDPPTAAEASQGAVDAEAPAVAPPPVPAAQSAAKGQEKPAREKPKKLTIYQEPEDTDRMRGAMVATIPYEGFTTLSKFAQTAIMEKVERLEQKYNGGKPFPSVGPGVIPAGRPMGE